MTTAMIKPEALGISLPNTAVATGCIRRLTSAMADSIKENIKFYVGLLSVLITLVSCTAVGTWTVSGAIHSSVKVVADKVEDLDRRVSQVEEKISQPASEPDENTTSQKPQRASRRRSGPGRAGSRYENLADGPNIKLGRDPSVTKKD
jgi:hypothetical protein